MAREGVAVLQIIGYKSCPESRKALRFCKEAGIEHQFVDLKERELSKGEWTKIFAKFAGETLINIESSYYKKEGYAWRSYDAKEELIEHPELLKTPILKEGNKVGIGFDLDFLNAFRSRL